MANKGLKDLSKRMASDLEFRNRVASGDEEALAEFGLSSVEKKAISMTRGLSGGPKGPVSGGGIWW